MTGVENSIRAHTVPLTLPPPLQKWCLELVCNVNIVHGAASMLYCTTVLYCTQHMQKGKGCGALVLFSTPVIQMFINKDIKYNSTSRNCFHKESVPLITLNDSQWERRSMNWIIDLSRAPLWRKKRCMGKWNLSQAFASECSQYYYADVGTTLARWPISILHNSKVAL